MRDFIGLPPQFCEIAGPVAARRVSPGRRRSPGRPNPAARPIQRGNHALQGLFFGRNHVAGGPDHFGFGKIIAAAVGKPMLRPPIVAPDPNQFGQ